VPWEWPDLSTGFTAADLRAVQSEVSKAKGRWRADQRATDWVGNLIARVLKLDLSNASHKANVKHMLRKWIENGMLVVV
jgi:hypothetical protein